VAFAQEVVRAGRPHKLDLRIMPGLGHLLFHDHLADSLPVVTDWVRRTLTTGAVPTEVGA
jgi:hypothetical protein